MVKGSGRGNCQTFLNPENRKPIRRSARNASASDSLPKDEQFVDPRGSGQGVATAILGGKRRCRRHA